MSKRRMPRQAAPKTPERGPVVFYDEAHSLKGKDMDKLLDWAMLPPSSVFGVDLAKHTTPETDVLLTGISSLAHAARQREINVAMRSMVDAAHFGAGVMMGSSRDMPYGDMVYRPPGKSLANRPAAARRPIANRVRLAADRAEATSEARRRQIEANARIAEVLDVR